MKLGLKSFFWTVFAFLSILLFNFLLISLFSRSASFAFEQMLRLKIYMLLIALGFSIQFLLFIKIRQFMKNSIYIVSGTGAMSTGTMVACCVHHIIELLPFLAAGWLSSIFINYQKELLIVSIVVNWLGVLIMIMKLRAFGKQADIKIGMSAILTLTFATLSIVLLAYTLINRDLSSPYNAEVSNEVSNSNFATKVQKAGAVEISATPLLTISRYEFSIVLNTHSTELNYDLTSEAILTNDKNQTLKPTRWEGDGLGGHHRTGKLMFTGFTQKPKLLTLTINNIDGQDVNFSWNL